MKKGERDLERLRHIVESIYFLESNTSEKNEELFLRDDVLKFACLKHLEIIGEAVNFLSEELIEKNSEIEWARMVGARNYYVHAYFNINWLIVWETIQSDLEPLKIKIEYLIKELS